MYVRGVFQRPPKRGHAVPLIAWQSESSESRLIYNEGGIEAE